MKKKKRLIFALPILLVVFSVIVIFLTIATITVSPTGENLEWLSERQMDSGFLEKFQSEDYNPRSKLYEQALSAIVFTDSRDYGKAKEILDALYYVRFLDGNNNHDGSFYSEIFPERSGISIAYSSTGAQRRVKDNSWVVLAILHYTAATGDESYIPTAKECGDWISARQITNVNTADIKYGAVYDGLRKDANGTWDTTDIISTESSCSAYAALKQLGVFLGDHAYIDKADLLKNWILNKAWFTNHFAFSYIGYHLEPQILPLLSLNKSVYLDSEKQKLNQAVQYAENNLVTEFSYPWQGIDRTFKGTFSEIHRQARNIWWEGTAMLAKAYNIQSNRGKRGIYMHELNKTLNNGGIPYSFADPTATNIEEYEWFNIPYNCISATTWFYLNYSNINPFIINFKEIDNFEYGPENEYDYRALVRHRWYVPTQFRTKIKVIKEPNGNHILSVNADASDRNLPYIYLPYRMFIDRFSFRIKKGDFHRFNYYYLKIIVKDKNNRTYYILLYPWSGTNNVKNNRLVLYLDNGYLDGKWDAVYINLKKLINDYFSSAEFKSIDGIYFYGNCYIDDVQGLR